MPALRRRVWFVGSCAAWLVVATLACSRIDDSDCAATRTCSSSGAGEGGAAGAPVEQATGGAEAGAANQ